MVVYVGQENPAPAEGNPLQNQLFTSFLSQFDALQDKIYFLWSLCNTVNGFNLNLTPANNLN